jgi:O-antigen/teichoic acid export membrane protein
MAQEKTISHKRFFVHSLTSLCDQALLSALNLIVGLVLIRLASKETYGLYAQLYVVGIFASTILDAIITSPLTTVAPGKPTSQRMQLFAQLQRLQCKLNAVLALLFGVGCGLMVYMTGTNAQPWLIGLVFALYIFLNAQREYLRSISFIEGKPNQTLSMDTGYVIAVGGGILVLMAFDQLTVAAIIFTLACANIVSLLLGKGIVPSSKNTPLSEHQTLAEIWQRGKWALPGALVAWLTNYSYLFLAAAFLGITASAELNAARLLLMPISLCVLAWSRIARPIASRLYTSRNWTQLNRIAWLSVIGIEALTLIYLGALWLMLPWLQIHVLGDNYQNVSPLVLAWGCYFAVNAARWVGSSWLTSNDQYKQLLASGVASLVIMFIASLLLIPSYGAWGAIAALIIVEICDLILIWGVFLPMAKRLR